MASVIDGGGNFPGGSKQRVNNAGNAVRTLTYTGEDVEAIDTWRAAHRHVLNTFQSILRNRTRGTEVVVAQRHKRKTTIYGKLNRFPTMQLSRMDDVAGCRVIFPSIEQLNAFREQLHGAHFKHELKNAPEKYDYIARPKSTGYRGIHDVYAYDANSAHGRPYRGLLLELQYRTYFQHAWATAVEVVGHITESQPKFQQGDKRYEEALSYASEIIARTCESMSSCHATLSHEEVVSRFLELDAELNLMTMLRALNSADNEVMGDKLNVLLILSATEELEVMTFRNATDALRELFRLEKEKPNKDIVLVRGDTTEDVRIAFRNYFADATEFIRLIDDGCQTLAGKAPPQKKPPLRTKRG